LRELDKSIEEETLKFPEFRSEIYEKLYDFFSLYFSDTGSLYFVYAPENKTLYEKIYENDEDMALFWRTKMLYYVKTDIIPKSSDIKVGNFNFRFDVSQLETKKANEKKSFIYDLKEIDKNKKIILLVGYKEGNLSNETAIEELIERIKSKGIDISEEILNKAITVFARQSQQDYFINKDAKKFLIQQFDLWFYEYLYKQEANKWTEKRIEQLQILRKITLELINFIAQFEDELVKIWNKPKFVLNSNYVITLDRIANQPNGIFIIEKILNHKNIEEQIKEWKELGIINKNSKLISKSSKLIDEIFNNTLEGKVLKKEYKHLPIDTKYFKDLELEILGLFDDLDKSLDGWLIHSENYQALNTILPKFKKKVQTIYIDPPFNKEQNADYLYNVKYKDSTWATMLENRLNLARDILNEKGSIFVRCDYNGNWIVRPLMNDIFGRENFRNEIIINRFKKPAINSFAVTTESFLFYSKSSNLLFKTVFRDRICTFCKQTIPPRWHPMSSSGAGGPAYILRKLLYPPKWRHWTYNQDEISNLEKEGRIRINEEVSYINSQGQKVQGLPEYLETSQQPVDSNWTDITGYKFGAEFQTENSEEVIKRVVESTSNKDDLVMDFFLGSGTTTAVAHKLGRKWIGVEMGEHFYTIVLPRMKKVLAYDESGISKEKDVREKYNEKNAGGFFKYYDLEQYADTLENTKYEGDGLLSVNNNSYLKYVFLKDLKMLDALTIDEKNGKINVNVSQLYANIDLSETLSNLLGLPIKRIHKDFVEFGDEDNTMINLNDMDWRLVKSLIWW
ncbi:MAG: site-specific DNA-methyltransferase, partial [Candidatus Micrarchaeia archaeon]